MAGSAAAEGIPLPAGGPGFTRRRRVRVPTILQMEAVECGAAALAMVLAHHGRWVPLEELRALCGTSRDGSKAVDLLKAARSLGLSAKGMRLEPAALEHMPLPALLFVDMNHFVVLEGGEPGCFYLNDPAMGRRRVSAAEFDGMFSGIALVFEKTEAFTAGGAPRRTLGGLARLAGGSRGAVLAIALAGVLLGLVALAIPAFSRVFVDHVLIGRLDDWLRPLLWAMSAALLCLALGSWLRLRLATRLYLKLALVLPSRLLWRLLRLPPAFFAQRHAGVLGARLQLAEDLARLASQQSARALGGCTLLVFLTGLMVQYSAALAALCLLLAAVNVLVFAWLQQRLGDASGQAALHALKMQGKLMQGLQAIETLKATGADDVFFARWSGLQALLVNAQQGSARMQAVLAAVPGLTSALSAAVVLTLGGLFLMHDTLTVGMLIAYVFVLSAFTEPVADLMRIAVQLRGARAPLAQLEDTLHHPLADEFSDRALASERMPARLAGRVSLRAVSAGYAPLDPAWIQDLTLELPPGSRVALVGASGSGKSTVGRLVAGMLAPRSGQVLFDGRPQRDWPRGLLRGSVAVVDQEIILFEGTVRENLSLWDDSMPLERIVAAAQDAMIHEVIMQRPGGYEARVEEGGRNFSGGQRQRLELARALTGDPSVLVLDEATSALDTLTEQAIMAALRRRGCTCLIIAHRLSTLRDCDEIIVLDHGRIVERGTHARLMRRQGAYHGLIGH